MQFHEKGLALAVALLIFTNAGSTVVIPEPDPEPIGGEGPQFSLIVAPAATLVTNKMGDTATFSVRLACHYGPCLSSLVTVTVRSSSAAQALVKGPFTAYGETTTLAFQNGNWYTNQTVTVKGVDDGHQLGPSPYTVTLLTSSSDSRASGLTASVPGVNQDRTDYNACVADMQDQFRSLPSYLHKLPMMAEAPALEDFECGTSPSPHPLCGRHFQGAARTKHGPYFIVTGNGEHASEFYVTKLAAKAGKDGPWGHNATTWENDVQVNYPHAYRISTSDHHAGGLSLFGDFAAIPLEGDSAGTLVTFWDLSNPEQPVRLTTDLWQPAYEYAGAVAVTKVGGRYLVAIMTNDPAEIQFYYSNTGDIRQPQSWSYKGGWSTQQHGFPSYCPIWGGHGGAATIQNMNFIQQCGGPLYLAVTYNSGEHDCNTGGGTNYVRLFTVDTASIIAASPTNALTDAGQRAFSCDTDLYDYCNFAAAAGLYVSPVTRQLMLYGAWYYSRDFPTSIGERRFILAGEFADEGGPPGHHLLVPRQTEQGITDGKLFLGREGPEICLPSRCASDWVYSQSVRQILLSDIHYVRVQYLPLTAWNATLASPFAQVDDNVRARQVSGAWQWVFDVYPTPGHDPDFASSPYFGTLRFVEQDDQGDNFGTPFYSGWPRSWKNWGIECASKADGDEDKNGLGVRLWSSGTDLSDGSTAILRDVSVCIIDDSPGDISPAWRVSVKRKSENMTPLLDNIPWPTVAEGQALTFSIRATDANDDTVTYSAVGMPAGAVLNPITGAFSWTPGFTQAGTHDVTFVASDDVDQGAQTARITVTNVSVPPVLGPIGNRTAYKATVFRLQLSVSDVDGGPFSFSASPLPPGATMNENTGLFEWLLVGTATYASSYTVTFRVSDSTGLSDSETVVIYVRNLTCLLAGTPVEMADGTMTAIEAVRVGDRVRSYNEATGEFIASSVTEVMVGSSAMHLVVNGELRVTDRHPIRVNGSWTEAGALKVGDVLLRSDGTAEIVHSINIIEREEPVYNLEVERTHTFCAAGRLVHNKEATNEE